MHVRTTLAVGFCVCLIGGIWTRLDAQRSGAFRGSTEDPAIKYSSSPLNNVVVDVNRRIQDGSIRLTAEGRSGFLRSALEALQIPVDSQLLVFSRASLQGKLINEQNPRALFFNDRVALGWVRGGEVIEVAAHDETAGVVFFTLDQRTDPATGSPQFKRAFECLGCHVAGDTLGVPGFLMFSTTRPDQSQGFSLPRAVDQSDALSRRFGGWFVTGSTGAASHMGNDIASIEASDRRDRVSVEGLFDADGYRALSSDIVAHLVFTHQVGHGQPSHSGQLAGAGGRPTAASAVHGNARRRGTDHRDDERSRQRGRGLPAVHRRSQADRSRARGVRICRAVLVNRPARSKGALAARSRSEPAPDEVSVQLLDLLAGLRRTAGAREGSDLPSHVAGFVR